MKPVLSILLVVFFATISKAQATKNTYSIDYIKADSLFLIETSYKPIEGSPRPQATVTAIFFKSLEELSKKAIELKRSADDSYYIAEQIQIELAKAKTSGKN